MHPNKVRSVLITGAEGALGRAVAHRFLEAGHSVIATYWQAQTLPDLPVKWVHVDLSQSSSREALARFEVDALVHCAGGFRYAKLEDTSDADLDFLLRSNLISAFHVTQAVLPGMRARGFGRIIYVSSKATLQAPAGMSAYAAAKAGINMLVASLAEETRGTEITVNAVMPSIIDTPANRQAMPDADPSKWVSREELAGIIMNLTQPESRAIHGALIPVSGRV